MGKPSNYFPGLSRTYKQNSRTFKDFPEQEKKSRTFPGCGNPDISRKENQLISFDETKLLRKEQVTKMH